jgi:hypothetical protein
MSLQIASSMHEMHKSMTRMLCLHIRPRISSPKLLNGFDLIWPSVLQQSFKAEFHFGSFRSDIISYMGFGPDQVNSKKNLIIFQAFI